MTETPEERARRLGLIAETPAERAARLGLKRSANLPDHDPPPVEPSYAQQALGGIASLVRDIPGAEAAQAGVRALVRGQSYREALSDIRSAEEAAPGIVRNYNRLAGAGLVNAVLPGGAALKGAQYGALTGALSSDPNSGLESRAIQAGTGAAAGAVAGHYLGKAADKVAPVAARARDAAITRFSLKDAVRPVMRLGEASAPKVEGLLSPARSIVSEPTAVAGRPAQSLENRLARVVAPVKTPNVAEGFIGNGIGNLAEAAAASRAEPLNITKDTPIDDALKRLLSRSAESLPRGEAASHLNLSDAEIGMGMVPNENAMTLAQQLEESLKHVKQGGTLRSAVNAAPRYAGRPILP